MKSLNSRYFIYVVSSLFRVNFVVLTKKYRNLTKYYIGKCGKYTNFALAKLKDVRQPWG